MTEATIDADTLTVEMPSLDAEVACFGLHENDNPVSKCEGSEAAKWLLRAPCRGHVTSVPIGDVCAALVRAVDHRSFVKSARAWLNGSALSSLKCPQCGKQLGRDSLDLLPL